MRVERMPDGTTIFRISKAGGDTCIGCIGDPQVSTLCKTLPPCGFNKQVWVDEAGYIKWLAEERMT